jgi:hypothetical protein
MAFLTNRWSYDAKDDEETCRRTPPSFEYVVYFEEYGEINNEPRIT